MATSMWRLYREATVRFQPLLLCRFIRGSPLDEPRHPGEMKTLNDVLKEINAKDTDLCRPINIGFPLRSERDEKEFKKRVAHRKQAKYDKVLEKAARTNTLEVPLDDIHAEWTRTTAPVHIKDVAEHYGIFDDLFRGAHFFPRVPLDVTFDYDEQWATKVFRGNRIKPSEARSTPSVLFESEPDSLWTLVLSNPDGHFEDQTAEYLHWFIGNIPGNKLENGEEICHYLQPFPPKGTGFHRFIFILYKQECRIDYSALKKASPCFSLKERTFKTFDFYKEKQDVLTPAGLSFFQCDWDETLKDFFHGTLRMREPVFEYDFPKPYVRPQDIIPKDKPFNIYLDKYRDPKDIGKEILLKRFKTVHPFDGEPPKLKYPLAQSIPVSTPEWLKTEIFKERMRIGKYRGLDVEIIKPDRPKRPVLGHFKPKHLRGDDILPELDKLK